VRRPAPVSDPEERAREEDSGEDAVGPSEEALDDAAKEQLLGGRDDEDRDGDHVEKERGILLALLDDLIGSGLGAQLLDDD